VPGEPEPVCGKRGHDVGELVAVDVVDLEIAAGISVAAERRLMKCPWRLGGIGRLLPPAVRRDDVRLTVAVDIAGADPVDARRDARLRDRVGSPRPGRI